MTRLTTTAEPPIVAPRQADVAPESKNRARDPYDPVDVDHARWFFDSRYEGGNEVIAYIRPDNYFRDAASAIRSATARGHFIEIAAWVLYIDMPLIFGDASTTLIELLTAADAAGVAVRALLWPGVIVRNNSGEVVLSLGYPRQQEQAAAFVNSLTNGYAIRDHRHLPSGSHHQKILVVNGSEGLVAFQGGIDINPDRRGDFHDVHTRLRGPAADRLHQVFYGRYVRHPDPSKKPIIHGQPSRDLLPKQDLYVRTVRTYGNAVKHGFEDGQPSAHDVGEFGVRQLVLHAIAQARGFIYIEDQYLVDPEISAALALALPRLEFVIILIPDAAAVDSELRIPRTKRQAFLSPLHASGPGKVFVFTGGSTYVHAKVWVFDDKFAIVGSANLNRRGMTHDSEQACGIYDTNLQRQWFFAHELRMNLWAKHLGRSPLSLVDPRAGWDVWKMLPLAGVNARPYSANPNDDPGKGFGDEYIWANFTDPDGS